MHDDKKERKKIAPIVISIVIIVFCGLFLLGQLAMMLLVPVTIGPGMINCLICGVIIVAVAVVLYLRLKEINGGEEDEASKY